MGEPIAINRTVDRALALADDADQYKALLGDGPPATDGWTTAAADYHEQFQQCVERLYEAAGGNEALLRLAAGAAEPEELHRPGRGLLICAAICAMQRPRP